MKTKLLAALAAVSVLASLAPAAPVRAEETDVLAVLAQADAENTQYALRVKDLDTEAVSVAMYDEGYARVRNIVEGPDIGSGWPSEINTYSLMDRNGRCLKSREQLLTNGDDDYTQFYYCDGVISDVDGLWSDSFVPPAYYTKAGRLITNAYDMGGVMHDGVAVAAKFAPDATKGMGATTPCDFYLINDQGETLYHLPEELSYANWMGGADNNYYETFVNFGWYSEGMIAFFSDVQFGVSLDLPQPDPDAPAQTGDLIDERKQMYVQSAHRGGYMDASGNVLISQAYDNALPFYGGIAAVKVDGKCGYIDRDGNYVIEPQYEEADSFAVAGLSGPCDYADVKQDGKWGYIDRQGHTVIPFEYDKAFGCDGNFFSVGRTDENGNTLYGIVDGENREVLPLIFDDITAPYDGIVFAIRDGKLYSIRIKAQGEPFLARGDVDDNDTVNANDASSVLMAAARIGAKREAGFDSEQMLAGDVNNDTAVNALDASMILRYAAYVGAKGTDTIEAYLGIG